MAGVSIHAWYEGSTLRYSLFFRSRGADDNVRGSNRFTLRMWREPRKRSRGFSGFSRFSGGFWMTSTHKRRKGKR